MNSEIWNSIRHHFFKNKTSFFNDKNNGYEKFTRKNLTKRSYRLRKNFFVTSYNSKSLILLSTKLVGQSNAFDKTTLLTNSPLCFLFFHGFFILKKINFSLIFFKKILANKMILKKNLKFYQKNYLFFETEIIFNLNLNIPHLRIFNFLENSYECVWNHSFKSYVCFFCFFIKKIKKFTLVYDKKKLRFSLPFSDFQILSEIKCKTINSHSLSSFAANFLRLYQPVIFFIQLNNFMEFVFLRLFSGEGTCFLNHSLSMQFEKLFVIKEIFNKIPSKRIKILFSQFIKLLVQKKYHQEFIFNTMNKISSEKLVLGNLLTIFKCISKIQEKNSPAPNNLVVCSLVTVFKEKFDVTYRFDDFIYNENQFTPIHCNIINKEVYFSSTKKAKETKESLNCFFFQSIESLGYNLYFKFLLIKLLNRIIKRPKYSTKSLFLEIVFKLTQELSKSFIKNNKIKKTIKKLEKHCRYNLKLCNIPRLFFFYQKQKTKHCI